MISDSVPSDPIRGVLRRALPLFVALLSLSFVVASTTPAMADLDSAKKALKKAVRGGDPAGIGAAIDALGATGDPKAAELILKVLPHITPEDVLDQLVNALVRIGDEKLDSLVKEKLEKLEKGKTHPDEISLLFMVAEKIQSERTEGWFLLGLESKLHRILRGATEQLVKLKSRRAVGVLIEQLEKAKPKTARNSTIRDALYELTGHDFDLIEDWQSFWAINAKSFDPAKVGKEEEGKTRVRKKRNDDSAEFFGVEIRAQRVMYVIDVSGSMQLWDEGGSEKGGSGASWQNRQRIRRVKQQLSESVRKLNKGARFNIVSFSDRVQIFSDKGIVPATKSWKGKAVKWVQGFQANGLTHTDDALKKAFEDRTIDTIVLLSDGAPTKQNQDSNALMDRIIKDVERWNKLRKIKIYTFGFDGQGKLPPSRGGGNAGGPGGGAGSNPLVEFLKKLAEGNGGEYVSID